MPDEVRERAKKILTTHQHFMMPRAQMLLPRSGIKQFTVCLFGVPDGKCLDGLAPEFCHQRRDRAGIESAAQKYAEWNITHQVTADRTLKQFAVTLDVVTFRVGLVNGGRR